MESGFYLDRKSPEEPKSAFDRAMKPQELYALLEAIKKAKQPFWKRDHCAIFAGYHLALRISEACLLERKHFRLIGKGTVFVPTLKRGFKVEYLCSHCGARAKLSSKRIGVRFPCSRCQRFNLVKPPKKIDKTDGPKEVRLPMLERFALKYFEVYIDQMPENQNFLLAGRRDKIGPGMLNRVFGTYSSLVKLSPHLSWHSLRHARANRIAEITNGDAGAVRDFLRQASAASAMHYLTTSASSHKLLKSLEDSPLKGISL